MSASMQTGRPRGPSPERLGSNPSAPTAGEDNPATDRTPGQVANDLDKEELLRRFKLMFQESRDHHKEFRQEAVECFDFIGGRQWSDEDRHILSDQGRPAVTFNRVQPFVDGVSGLEIGNRQATTYLPRQVEKSGVNELLSGANSWARDECDADFEESEMFRDCVICGVGATQTRMSYDDDPSGNIIIERVDPLEMYPDPSSRKPNYSDARYVMRVKDIPVKTAEEMFPKFTGYDLHARWAEDEPAAERMPHNARLAPYYRIDQSGEINRERMQCRLVEVEWWDWVPMYSALDPTSGTIKQMEATQAGQLRVLAKLAGQPIQLVKSRKKRFYRAIVGNEILSLTRGPDDGGFTYKFITGKRDRNMACWYGLVRAMRDPQMWANKFMSQSLHIVNTNAKGGLLAETDAFVDLEEARDAWAEADSIVELNPGGLGKVKQKDVPNFPVQINNMMEAALAAIPATAGINMEMIAQQTADQPAILEMQRKQQGMTVLAYIFNAKRRYQKEQGRLMLWMIQNFISDGRLIRIGGQEQAQYVPLVRQEGVAEYDVVIDDAPTSPNQKERVWAMIMQMMPVLRTLPLPPQALIEFMKYSPFPASLIQKLQQMAMQGPPQDPAQQAAMQSMTQLNQAKAAAAAAQAQLAQAKAGQTDSDMAHRYAQAQHSAAMAQMEPLDLQSQIDERTAKIDLMAAQSVQALGTAVNQFQNAAIAPDQAAIQSRLMENEFAHKQSMDQAGHALQLMQALRPPPPLPAPLPKPVSNATGAGGPPGGQGAPAGGPGGPPGGAPASPGGAPMPPPQPPPGPPGGADLAAQHAMGPFMTPPSPGPMPPGAGAPFGVPPPPPG